MSIFKVAALGIVAVIMALQFKQMKGEYASIISLAAGCMIFVLAVDKLEVIVDGIKTISSYITINTQYLSVLIKVIGVAYICEFSSSICKDAGFSAIASQIEMVGKLTILVMSMPILLSLLDTVNSFF